MNESENEEDRALSVEGASKIQAAKILPLHEATRDHARAHAGRPRRVVGRDGKVKIRPQVSDLEYNAEVIEQQVRFVDADSLVQAVEDGTDSSSVLKILRTKAARDAAALEFQRNELEKLGKDTSQIISRHTKVLKEVASLDAELRTLTTALLDVRTPQFRKVVQFWLSRVGQAAKDTLSPEQADLFFNKLQVLMEDWEEQVLDNIR